MEGKPRFRIDTLAMKDSINILWVEYWLHTQISSTSGESDAQDLSENDTPASSDVHIRRQGPHELMQNIGVADHAV